MDKQDFLDKLATFLNENYEKKFSSKFDFAGAINVDESTVRRIFKAEQNISIKVLLSIADAFKMKPSELLKKIGC